MESQIEICAQTVDAVANICNREKVDLTVTIPKDYISMLIKYCVRYGDSVVFSSIVSLIHDENEYINMVMYCAAINNMTMLRYVIGVFVESNVDREFLHELLRSAVYINFASGYDDVYRYCRNCHTKIVFDNRILLAIYKTGSEKLFTAICRNKDVNPSRVLYFLMQANDGLLDTHGTEMLELILTNDVKYGYAMTAEQLKHQMQTTRSMDPAKFEWLMNYAQKRLGAAASYFAEAIEALFDRACTPLMQNPELAIWLIERNYVSKSQISRVLLPVVLRRQDIDLYRRYITLNSAVRDVQAIMFLLVDTRGLRDDFLMAMLDEIDGLREWFGKISDYIVTNCHYSYNTCTLPFVKPEAWAHCNFAAIYSSITEIYLSQTDLEEMMSGTSTKLLFLTEITRLFVSNSSPTIAKNTITTVIDKLERNKPINSMLLYLTLSLCNLATSDL